MIHVDYIYLLAKRPYPPEGPYALCLNLFDIPETIKLAIRNVPGKCRSVSVAHKIGRAARCLAIDEGVRKGVQIIFTAVRGLVTERVKQHD